ncbi:MAG: V-type ATPase subunit [Candidatus Bathyarchaeia archaeon]
MKQPETIYLITRIHGRKTHLLNPEDFNVMAKSRSLTEIVTQLMRSDYAVEISKLPSREVDSSRLEMIFLKTLVDRYFTVVKDARGKIQDFLRVYAARIEVENLKRILRAKHTGESVESRNLIPLEREHTIINFPALLKAEDVEETISLLKETPYAPLSSRLETYRRVGLPIILESLLDKIYFEKVLERMEGLVDEDNLRWLICQEIDLRNLLLIFTLKLREATPRLIEDTIIPIHYKLRRGTVRRLAQGRIEDAKEILAGIYSRVANEISMRVKEESRLETIIAREIYGCATFALTNFFLELSYVVAYMLLCEREAKNLITVTTALDLGMSEEDLRGRIL